MTGGSEITKEKLLLMIGKLIPHYQNTVLSNLEGHRIVSRVVKIPLVLHLEIGGINCPTTMGQFQFNPFRDLLPGGTLFGVRKHNWWFKDGNLVGFLLKLIFNG